MRALEGLFQRGSSIVSRKIAGEMILVPVRRNVGEVECLYALNEVGARIWELIDGQRSLQGLRDALVREFEVSEAEAQEDLIMVIEQLKDIGAIQEVV